MRFLADENVSRLIIERLRAGGFDVISVGETRSGTTDNDVLETADAESSILIIEDRDFGELVLRQPLASRSIAFPVCVPPASGRASPASSSRTRGWCRKSAR